MASKLKFGWQQAWMGLFALIFFVGSLVLVNPANVYVSPDETANRYFAEQFTDTFVLKGPVDAMTAEFDRLHPRSTLVDQGRIIPGSFLGLPFLYGLFALVFGSWVFWILTPLMTLFAALAWRKIVAHYTSDVVGNLSFVLFLLHPAVWYYSARGLMHNTLFIDLLILGVWLWILRPIGKKKQRPSIWNEVFSGLLIGLALFVRTSELIWVLGILGVAAIIWWKTVSWRRVRAGLFGLAVGIGFLLLWNALTYGSPFVTGYTIGAPAVTELSISDSMDAIDVLPFGLHPKSAWIHFSSYAVTMFWWLSLLAIPGFFMLLSRTAHRRTIRWVTSIAVLMSVWLVLMYGSWEIHDNPDPTQITMANSYVRYWLPMYIFTTPLIALTINWLSEKGRSMLSRGLIVAILLLTVVGWNVNAVFVQGDDGLFKMRDELAQSSEIQASVLRYTEPDSVIIVDRGDKIFFPHRYIWYPLRDDSTYDAMPELVEKGGLYYYGITFPQEDLDYLNESRLKRMDLEIELIETYDEESLYRIF